MINFKIYTKLTDDEIDHVLEKCQTLPIRDSLRVLWGLFKDLEGDINFEKIKRRVKVEGWLLTFDLRSVTYGIVDEYFDSNNVKIRGCKKVNIYKYWDELEYREKAMKEILREQYSEEKQQEGEIEGHE